MNCKNCGAEIQENTKFCGSCGVKIETEQPVFEEPVYEQDYYYQAPAEPVYAEPVVPAEKPNTVLWIVLSAVEIFTCCQITGIISLIFSILGHIAADKGDFAEAEKKIKTAKIWFWVGFGLGILAILIYVICVGVLGFAAGVPEEILSAYYY